MAKRPTARGPKINPVTLNGAIEDNRQLTWWDDERAHHYYVRKTGIEAGCRSWDTFKAAFAHYADPTHELNNDLKASWATKDDIAMWKRQRARIEKALRLMQARAKQMGWKL